MIGSNFPFEQRSRDVAGPLAPLASSLAADLDRLLPDDDFFIPAEKARMTRRGGRCERDGAFLEFDPQSPRLHRCPACNAVFDAEEHYRWWIMGYQLWLSERAIHAAALGRLAGGRYVRLAEAIVRRLGEHYTDWPNADNVLGPSRVFFSTYLESIWLLQLSVAVSILEAGATSHGGDQFRERIVQPSSALIAQFNEGLSNRQVWNSAALGIAANLLGRQDQVDRAIHGTGGLRHFLDSGLLSDGSWYEGENYHLFAHRGLWYLVTLADDSGAQLPDESLRRFAAAFVAPLRTALPDYTFPARRDSQYRASLRQWRIAESLELGLARSPGSAELAAGLTRLYSEGSAGDAARWRSTGEAERNVPGVCLTRADLGWKSLLFARPRLPDQPVVAARSALMEGQGFGVIRRDEGQTYVALDYGHTGGSHGHPDRLNLWLVLGDQRVFEDVGTGSYVERTLHWYRSTLAHNAPLIDGQSQDPVPGSLRAWDERGDYAWIDAGAGMRQGVLVRRSVVIAPGYIIDRLAWTADRDVTLDLPLHVDGNVVGATWLPGTLSGGSGLEDGFDFLTQAETAGEVPSATIESGAIMGAVIVDASHAWWRAVAPGPPGDEVRPFLLVRARGHKGSIVSVWSWRGAVELERLNGDSIRVEASGVKTTHQFSGDVWRIVGTDGESVLDGRYQSSPAPTTGTPPSTQRPYEVPLIHGPIGRVGDLSSGDGGLRFALGQRHYRRTEVSWPDAGGPEAFVAIAATADELLVEVTVPGSELNFAAGRADNPLDNEHPDTNSEGMQLHLAVVDAEGIQRSAAWLLVPEAESDAVRVSARGDAPGIPVSASWKRAGRGWQLLGRLQRSSLGPLNTGFAIDVIVNEMPRGRERRRGQLVLSAREPGWAYLRGDRQEIDQLIPMVVRHG